MMSFTQEHACPMSNRQLNVYVWRGIVEVENVLDVTVRFTRTCDYFWQQAVVCLTPCKIDSIYPITILNAVCLVFWSVPLLSFSAGPSQRSQSGFPLRVNCEKDPLPYARRVGPPHKPWLTENQTRLSVRYRLGGKLVALEGIWGVCQPLSPLTHMYKLH